MSGTSDETNVSQESQPARNQTEDSGEIVFTTPTQKADRVVSTLEKEDSATNANPLNFGQDLSIIHADEYSEPSSEKPLSELEQVMQMMQAMNAQVMGRMENDNRETRKEMAGISREIFEIKTDLSKQIAEIRRDNELQIEKLEENMEFKVSTFISGQEKDIKIFMAQTNEIIDNKMKQTEKEMLSLMNDEKEDRLMQAEVTNSTVEHNQAQLLSRLLEHEITSNKVNKIAEEKLGNLEGRVSRNQKNLILIHKDVERCVEQNDKVMEEVAGIKGKIDSNITTLPVISSHAPSIRINIPTFSGNSNTTMAPHFLNTLEEYFAITNVHKSQWLTYLGQAFQGAAMAWFRQVRPSCTNWDVFKKHFLENYHGAVQRMRYAAQVEESKQRLDEKAESFIWRVNDVIKLAYPRMQEEEIVMCIIRKMKSGFGALIRDNITSILGLVQKANEMEEVIRIDGKTYNSSSNNNNGESSGNNQYRKPPGSTNQQSNYRPNNNDRGGWRQGQYQSDRDNNRQDQAPRGDSHNSNSQSSQNGPSQRSNRDNQPMQVSVVSKGKGAGKKSSDQDTNLARTQDGHLNGPGSATKGQVNTPSTSA